uniref:adenylyltransferase/cytidyltransferase family protein n=1 Tax=Acetatifactor sp. TaxID=1872090 RepID=UPI0040570B52
MGPCTSFGAYVGDFETIEFYIQEKINKNIYPYEVVNCSLMGPKYIEQGFFIEQMAEGDKVVLFLAHLDKEIIRRSFPKAYKCELSEVYSKVKDPINCWVDSPAHCNDVVNEAIAECIWDDMCRDGEWILEDEERGERRALQDYYIPYEIHRYYDEYIENHLLCLDENKVVGAIVMNCNPFTKGHKYLIEKACECVDLLYVFVVEEDKSYYSFKDRYEMVKKGVEKLAKVRVLPSGKFILSKDTFAQYFDKESIKEVEDMSWDIRIFGEIVAKKLGITYRFVGEEPRDIVTREYNEIMKKILLEYGVKVMEMPRICTHMGGEVISATIVRKLVLEKTMILSEFIALRVQ